MPFFSGKERTKFRLGASARALALGAMWAGAHSVGRVDRARLSIIGHSEVTRPAEPRGLAI